MKLKLLSFHCCSFIMSSTSVPLSLSLLQLSSSPGGWNYIFDRISRPPYNMAWPGSISRSLLQDCVLTQYGVRECSQYPVQKPVEKCASVPKQTCVRSRLKQKCKNVRQNVCRKLCHLDLNSSTLLTSRPPLTIRKWNSKEAVEES